MQQLGKYQLIRKLATGGMAEVYLAKAAGPMGFEKTLVVKRILPHLAEDPAFVEMFLGEAKLAAQLNHPNIVQIFDFGEADGDYFLAMEYIDGPNLRVLLKRATAAGVPLPPALCSRLIAAACEGLAFAHDFQDPGTGETLGLIHRDISPDNILVSRQGAVKVVDFGIAKAANQSHKTQSGVIKGKLAYMPPEQVRAKALDRRVDVYALGVVLYELVTGHKPYDASTDASIMQAILFEPLVPAVEYRPDLPEALQRILDRALTKDREQRYPDCLALAADLEEFILSVGKPVTTQQIVQLIAQVTPNADAPMPTPHGTPRSGSGAKSSATPTHTPAPSSSPGTGSGIGSRTGSGTGSRTRPRPSTNPSQSPPPSMMVPRDADTPLAEPINVARTQVLEGASDSTKPSFSDSGDEEAPSQPDPREAAPRRRMLIPAVLGSVALLVVGGGYLMWTPRSVPVPEQPTVIPPTPVVATPGKAPSPPAPQEPSTTTPGGQQPGPADKNPQEQNPNPQEQLAAGKTGETTAPPSGTAPSGTTPSEDEKPPVVATATPPANPDPDPAPRPTRPTTTRVTRPKPPAPAPVVGKGTLSFRVRPFATVIVNGRNLGQTPFDPVELPAGKYTVRFVNDELKKNVSQTVELKPGETKVVKLNLEE